MAAHAVWVLFPGEIASDLSRFHHIRIADWHQGRMCSHELLELCEYMPDYGSLKPAIRRFNPLHPWLQDPSELEAALYQTANENAVIRAVQAPDAHSDDMGSKLFITPSKLREMVDERLEADEGREDAIDVLSTRRRRDDEGESD